MEEKVFVVFNTANIGDVLVTNTLVQNIKLYFPESRVVFVCNTPIHDVAKYQAGVNDVINFDKKNDNSLSGILKFAKRFPYKKPFASFVTYANDRNLLISRLIGSKHIISYHKFALWNTDEKYEMREYTHMKDKWGGMIEPLTNEHKNLPIKYIPPDVDNALIQRIKKLSNPVILSTTSNFYKKDMNVQDCAELINLLNNDGFTPVMTGAGEVARKFVLDLKKEGCIDFVDIVDCTSFVEFANIMKICGKCITVDTGTLHFANALNVPVVGIFYSWGTHMWASDKNLYPAIILDSDDGKIPVTPNDIMQAFKELLGTCL